MCHNTLLHMYKVSTYNRLVIFPSRHWAPPQPTPNQPPATATRNVLKKWTFIYYACCKPIPMHNKLLPFAPKSSLRAVPGGLLNWQRSPSKPSWHIQWRRPYLRQVALFKQSFCSSGQTSIVKFRPLWWIKFQLNSETTLFPPYRYKDLLA